MAGMVNHLRHTSVAFIARTALAASNSRSGLRQRQDCGGCSPCAHSGCAVGRVTDGRGYWPLTNSETTRVLRLLRGKQPGPDRRRCRCRAHGKGASARSHSAAGVACKAQRTYRAWRAGPCIGCRSFASGQCISWRSALSQELPEMRRAQPSAARAIPSTGACAPSAGRTHGTRRRRDMRTLYLLLSIAWSCPPIGTPTFCHSQ